MGDTIRCPDCGHENPPGLDVCARCGFPLEADGGHPPQEPPPAPATTGALAGSGIPYIPRPRRRPPRPPSGVQANTLWLVFGTIAAVAVIGVAVKSNVDRASRPVEGSTVSQQAAADSLLEAIGRDSTDVRARARLGDILYDTGNWSEAIVQYRAAVRMDSSLTGSLVDLGVCYYNLGNTEEAERHFRLGLARDPHQPVALYNLGIVYEHRKKYREAIEYFHRALNTSPPEEMRQGIVEAMQRIQQQLGLAAPPLDTK